MESAGGGAKMEKYNKRVPGRISGVLLILLGGLGMAYKILLVWMDILLMQEFQNEELPELARTQMVFTAKDVCLAILCLILLIWGVRKIVRVIRFYRFKKFIGDREIVALEELAEKFHTSKTKIRSELEMMIQHNYLLQGHVNQEFPCLITTDQKYKEYLQVLETLEQEKKEWEELGFDEEKRKIVERAQSCLSRIQESVAVISAKREGKEVFLEDLHKLECGVKKLISVCSHNPANLQEMSMFLNYYLPTAEKFAREYEQLLGYENFGENMESLKQDIPQGVRELAEAFEQIAIRMCDKMEINIFQDITVLEVLMAQVGDKIYMLGTMRDKMIPLVFGVFCFLLGVFLIYRGPRDFRRYRRYQLFKSICAGREYVEIEEIAREGRCSPSSALRSTKQMLKKHLLTGAVLDVQEGMILFGEEVKASYQKAWSQWNQKQNVYRAVGVSLEEQEAFLLGKQQAEELQELAGEIEESNIRALLQRVAEVYVSRFDHAEKERGNFEFLQTVRADYLPEVEKMARKYIQMEKLDETAKDTFAAEKFGKFLENFPGMDGL